MSAISIRGVTKTFASGDAAVAALSDIDLDVAEGELMLLMGPSGSGKTTLLSIMGCILRPTSGQVLVAGDDITTRSEADLPAFRRSKIGFVFQGFNLFGALTVQQNVELAFDIRGRRGRQPARAAADLLRAVGLGEKLDAHPADLSGGQKQRVAIARALAGDPAIVLGDEPTAALDSASGRRVMQLLRTLAHEHGRAVVIVTHDSRMLDYADRLVRIEDGRLVGDESPGPAGHARWLQSERLAHS